MIAAEPRGEALKNVLTPSLIIHGDVDPVASLEHGKYLAACLPNSQLEIIEKMGHGIPDRIYVKLIELIKNHFLNMNKNQI